MVSACLGALVGLIRQWSDQKASSTGEADFGGVRTYTFWAILGCVGAFITDSYAAAVLPIVIALVGVHLTALHLKNIGGSHPGSTTFAASLLTCLLGALVQWDHIQAAVLVAAATAVMIGLKQPIHAWTRTFTVDDIRATLQFVAITGVMLPLVPNQDLSKPAVGDPEIDYPPTGFIQREFDYYAIDAAGNREVTKKLTIKQHAPDLTAPITFFDAQSMYVGPAVIHLTGTDDVEGQGVDGTVEDDVHPGPVERPEVVEQERGAAEPEAIGDAFTRAAPGKARGQVKIVRRIDCGGRDAPESPERAGHADAHGFIPVRAART